tara:strand:- start:2554 stop:2811 length:258 start_codon:yes stop_codon:yes gene_type:complete
MKYKKIDTLFLALTAKTVDHSVYTLEVGGIKTFLPFIIDLMNNKIVHGNGSMNNCAEIGHKEAMVVHYEQQVVSFKAMKIAMNIN